MEFDPSTAKEVGFEYSFDPSTAKEEGTETPTQTEGFDPSTAVELGKTNLRQDFKQGMKNLGQSMVTESSMPAAGALSTLKTAEDNSLFGTLGRVLRSKLGIDEPDIAKWIDQIFQNQKDVNEAIQNSSLDSGMEGQRRGMVGEAVTQLPNLLKTVAGGLGSGPMLMAQMGKDSFIGTATAAAPNTTATEAIMAGATKAAFDAATAALPIGKGVPGGIVWGAGGNLFSEFAGNKMLELYFRSTGNEAAAKTFEVSSDQLGGAAIVGGVYGAHAGRINAKNEFDAVKREESAIKQLKAEVQAELDNARVDVDTSGVRTPQYMKPKVRNQAQEMVDAGEGPANRELTTPVTRPNNYKYVGLGDEDMASAVRTVENDAYAAEQGWTGQEPGIGKGEILEDVDLAAAKNPYFQNEDQAVQAQVNALAGKGPGYGEMGFQLPKDFTPGPWPTEPDVALNKAIESANRAANAKGGEEKAKAKADAAADQISAELIAASKGGSIDSSVEPHYQAIAKHNKNLDKQDSLKLTEPSYPAEDNPLFNDLGNPLDLPDVAVDLGPIKLPDPEPAPDVPTKTINEVSGKLSAAFLKSQKKKQGGWIGGEDYTGFGFRDLVEGFRKAAVRVFNSIPPDIQREIMKGEYKDKNGNPIPFGHGTQADFVEHDTTRGEGSGLVHLGDLAATHIISDRNIKRNITHYSWDNEQTTVAGFRAFLINEMKERGLTDVNALPNDVIKSLRQEWMDYRNDKLEKAHTEAKSRVERDFKFLNTYLKTFGEQDFLKHIKQDSERKGKTQKTIATSLQEVAKRMDLIHLLEGVSLKSDGGKELSVQAYLKMMREKADKHNLNTFAPPSANIRPMFVSLRKGILIEDMGNWFDVERIIRTLAGDPREDIKFILPDDGTGPRVKPLSLIDQVGPNEKISATILINDLKKQLKEASPSTIKYEDLRKTLYEGLESLGFDHFIYENRAEAITTREMDLPETLDTPSFSIATWRKDRLHEWGALPRRQQGGFLDSQAFIEGAKRIASWFKIPVKKSDYDYAKWLEAKNNADMFETSDELLAAYPPDAVEDLPAFGKNVPTTNQLMKLLDHPWFDFVFRGIAKSKREANVRHIMYADALSSVFKIKRKEQISLFKTLVDIQAPELKDARQLAESTNSREQFLIEQGLDPKLVPHAIRVLDVMKHVYMFDNQSTERIGRNPFPMEPMYFPRAHTGKFNLTIRTAENDVTYATGFDSGVEAQKVLKKISEENAEAIRKGELFVKVVRNHYGETSDLFNILALQHGVPESISRIAAGIEKDIDIAKRTFELSRSRKGVGGFIGEVLADEKSWKGRLQNDKLLNLLQNRLRSSHDWEVRSKIIERVKSGMFDDPSILHDKPEFREFVGQMLAREMGHDVSANTAILGKVEGGIQKAAESASKAIDKHIYGKWYKYDGGDLALISPKALQETAQAWTYVTSFVKLALNPPVLVANASAIPLVFADGARTAAKLKVSQAHAIAAYLETIAYLGNRDADATKFMQQAVKEGMIEPHISELYSLADTAEHPILHKKKVDALNKPRNLIEKGTNFTAILYYYNFYRRVAPGLKDEALKTLVYESARSYTGDYSQQALPMMFSQAGSAGRLMTNFAKWKWNQIGRFADDLKDAKNGNLTPVALNMATQVLVAGLYGTAGAVDYEALRRLGKLTGLWNWKPFSAFFEDIQDTLAEEGIDPVATDWMRRGAINEVMSSIGQELGYETVPDLSGTMRHSSPIEAPTVALSYAKTVFVDALPTLVKALWQAAEVDLPLVGKSTGVTVEEREAALDALPAILTNPVRHALKVRAKFGDSWIEHMRTPGEMLTHGKYNEKGLYRRSEEENVLGAFNFRTAKENDYMDKHYYNNWLKQNRTEQITKRVKGIIANQDDPIVFENNVRELAVLGGAQTVRNIVRQLKTNEVNKNLSADEQAAIILLNTLDPTRKRFMLDQLNRLQESHSTSSDR